MCCLKTTTKGQKRTFKLKMEKGSDGDDNNNTICIGGLMDLDLKKEIRKRIGDVVNGSHIVVTTDYENTCPDNFNGNDDKNIVQRIGINSLQIEQSKEARKCYGIDIADAVADVIGP